MVPFLKYIISFFLFPLKHVLLVRLHEPQHSPLVGSIYVYVAKGSFVKFEQTSGVIAHWIWHFSWPVVVSQEHRAQPFLYDVSFVEHVLFS
jgi:hypothetical protein